MERWNAWQGFLLILLGLIGISSGAPLRGLFAAPPPPPPAAPGPVARAATSVPHVYSVSGPSQVDWLLNTRDTVALLAEHLGVVSRRMIGPEVAHTTTRTSVPRRRSACQGHAAAWETLETLTKQPVRLATLQSSIVASCECEAFGGPRGDSEDTRPEVSANDTPSRTTAADRRWEAACLLAQALERARDIEVTFVITTQPDYVDSKSNWLFDLHLDALERAAVAAGYVSDRFFFPDAGAAAGRQGTGTADQALRHASEPAALLFRGRSQPADPGQKKQLKKRLILLIVPEIATSGIEREPLLSAMALASAWRPGRPILLLGPSFSGSRDSLRQALEEAFSSGLVEPLPASAAPYVRIVSGNATSAENKATLDLCMDANDRVLRSSPDTEQCPPARRFSQFFATSSADKDYERLLATYLAEVNPDWEHGHHVARLIESNTGWGAQFLSAQFLRKRSGTLAGDATADPSPPEGQGTEVCERSPGPFPCAWTFTFPLHISRLSAEASAATAKKRGNAEEPPADGGTSKDVPPAMTPSTTVQMAQTALEQVLRSIRRLDITAVGIYATDKRDHLFLAQEISRRAPNVQLFSLEGNLIYLFPDFRVYLRGAVVAGSYPLFSLTQPTPDSGGPPRQQFPTMGAQGTYNALLALLDRPDRMIDYDACTDRRPGCGPWVWLGLVGRDGFWPIRREMPDNERDKDYRWTSERWPPSTPPGSPQRAPAAKPRMAASETRFPRTVWAVLVAVLLAAGPVTRAALAMLVRVTRTRRQRWVPARILNRHLDALAARLWAVPRLPRGRSDDALFRFEYRLSLLAQWGGILAAGAGLAELLVLRLQPSLTASALERARDGTLLALGAAAVLTLVDGWRSLPNRSGTMLQRSPALLVAAWALWEMRQALEHLGDQSGDGLGSIRALRLASFDTLTSPLVPVVLFCAALYLWGTFNLRRIHRQCIHFNPDSPLMALLGGDDREAGSLLTAELNSPALQSDWLGFGLVLLFVLAVLGFAGPFRYTADGASMGMTLLLGTLLLVLIGGHTLAYSCRLGRLLLRCLKGLNLHPIGRAFSLVAREPFVWRLSLDEPHPRNLAALVRQARALAEAIAQRADELPARPSGEPEASPQPKDRRQGRADDVPTEGALDSRRHLLGQVLQLRWSDVPPLRAMARLNAEDAQLPAAPRLPFQATPVWLRTEALTADLERMLERGPWKRHPLRPAPKKEASQTYHQEAEALIALQLALVLQHLLGRLAAALSVGMVIVLLLLGSHLFYSFVGRQLWLWIDWVAIAMAAAVALALMVRLEKDPVMSRLWSTHPGRIDWSGGLIRQIVTYGVIPILTLFATLFPEVGSTALSWLEPVRKALP